MNSLNLNESQRNKIKFTDNFDDQDLSIKISVDNINETFTQLK